ncbi:TPA: site-specific integrase [Staphylococcus aureus]|uniref:site-specific integrase n=1 Tax=Staphylococcus aureus TaxID=1280 RepID=UPI000914DA2E|nr:site-specific integrase [Staphylococcus aureus]MCQ6724403.1 site-specific integrase [Staphylococcus aureus]MCQ6726700.1 site-specific integrase [Staphylococcus aureus]MCQ6728363.1 site-specific integrase [Staphylococcus aureus]MCR0795278.1 site-specific integrase [Staphylococcus aureus]MCR0844451.1 site-specific integrase [Staphylococcus aureus]
MGDNTIAKANVSFDNPYLTEYEVTYTTNLISELKSKGVFLSKSFYDDIWLFSHEYSPGRTIKLDCGKIDNDLNREEKLLIKCWIGSLLEKYRPSTCIHYFHHFCIAVNITKFFSLDRINHFVEWLHEDHITNNEKTYVLSTVFSFFDFSEIDNSSKYLAKLYDVRNKIKFVKNPIQLPSSKYILLFSYYLEKYFADIKKDKLSDDEEIIKKTILFYPILIWWNLTTIIPIRSTEFCLIKRDSISKEGNRFFLTITRIKKPLNDAVNYYNKIEINESMYHLLNNYIELTEEYGESETLISYRSLIYADNPGRRELQKRDLNSFNKNNLEKLLKRFYKEVINEYYHINVPANQKLSPNDTRHIAFVSLMMQGISPVEIARLGGHRTIAAQYHYSFHKEYWIDNEVFKLIKNYKNISNFDNNIRYIPENVKLKAFESPTSSFRGELEIGYCSDSLIRCEAKECMLCSHWRIDLDDLKVKHDQIIEKVNKNHDNLMELMNFIYKIHTNTALNIMTPEHLENEKDLEQTHLNVKSELQNLSKLIQIERSIY